MLAAALIVLTSGYYVLPKTFGENINPSDVDHISVFAGNNGKNFTVTDPEEIRYIVENIQSHPVKKDGISYGRKGYCFRITCLDSNNNPVIPVFILNSDSVIRKDPFFYSCDGGLCFEYLKECEVKYTSDVARK